MILLALALVLLRVLYSLAEIYFEHDWPRRTWRGLAIAIALLFLCGSAFGQTVVRWDLGAYTTNNASPQPGQMVPVLALPFSTVQICATWTTGVAACNTLATTYTDSTGGTPCSTDTQLTPALGGACTNQVDSAGSMGVWIDAGAYAYVLTTSYGVFGPYPFEVGAGGDIGNWTSISAGSVNGVYNPAQCAGPSAPSWCSGSDMGAWVNAAVQALPSTGGAIFIPQSVSGCYSYHTQIVIDRPIHLSGSNSGFSGAGTCLQWTGGASAAIAVNGVGTNGASSHSILENFSLTNTGTGTVGIDIYNGQYNIVLRHIVMESPFSVAGVRLGASGSVVIDTTLEDVRIAYQVIGLDAISANTIECNDCHIYNSSTTNVQLGAVGLGSVNVAKFQGGNVEQDQGSGPSFLINSAQSIFLTDVYTELNSTGSTIISVPNTANKARNIAWTGGYVNMNGATNASVMNTANSDTMASFSNMYITGVGSGSAFFSNTAFSYLTVHDIYSDNLNQISNTSSAGIEIYNFVSGVTSTYMNGSSLLGWKNNAGTGWDQIGRDSSDYMTWTGAGAALSALKLGASQALTGVHGNAANVQASDNTGTSGNFSVFDGNGNVTNGPAPHGNAAYAQMSDNTGTQNHAPVYDANANLTNSGLIVQSGSYNGSQAGLNIFTALPTCNAGTEGLIVNLTDSNTGTWGATITAGSSTYHVRAYCNGTNWVVD